MLNVCLIGVSGFGNTHYEWLIDEVSRSTAKLLAATVINQDEEADKCAYMRSLGAEIFTDYTEMLAKHGKQSDICFIPTGIHLHAPMTIDGLRAGTNVFVEKPVAATIQEVRAMKTAQDQTGRFVAVGYQSMYAVDIGAMKRKIIEGALGKILAVKCRGLWPRNDAYYSRNNWAGKLKANGAWVLDSPFNNALAHYLNLICFLGGSSFEKSARIKSVQAELYRGNEIESADTAAMRIVTETDLPLYFFVSHCTKKFDGPEIVVRGERGVMTWNFHNSLNIDYSDGRTESLECDDLAKIRPKIFDALARRAAGEDAFICDLNIAGTQTLCVNAAHQATPIRTVESEFISREPLEGSTKTVITGVDEAIDRGFDEEKLFFPLGVPWAHEAEVFSVESFETFEGPAQGAG